MTSTNHSQNSKGIIKTMTILHYAFCLSILIFGSVALYITDNKSFNFSDTEDIFFYFVPLCAIMATIAGRFLFQRNLKQVHKKVTLKDKLTNYQSIVLIRMNMVEAPAFLSIIICLITSNQFYLIISALLLIYLFSLRPTTSIIKEDLELNSEQEREFREAIKL